MNSMQAFNVLKVIEKIFSHLRECIIKNDIHFCKKNNAVIRIIVLTVFCKILDTWFRRVI